MKKILLPILVIGMCGVVKAAEDDPFPNMVRYICSGANPTIFDEQVKGGRIFKEFLKGGNNVP